MNLINNLGSMKIEDFITLDPITIKDNESILKVEKIMKKQKIRHLPVMDGENILGIVSERDLALALKYREPSECLVRDIMTKDPYLVSYDSVFKNVISTMCDKKYGSALVCDSSGKLIGIFTLIDVLKAFLKVFKD